MWEWRHYSRTGVRESSERSRSQVLAYDRLKGSETYLSEVLWIRRVHAYGVCDDPEYFYDYIDGLIDCMTRGLTTEVTGTAAAVAVEGGTSTTFAGSLTRISSRDLMRAVQAKGVGYAISTKEELLSVMVSVGEAYRIR